MGAEAGASGAQLGVRWTERRSRGLRPPAASALRSSAPPPLRPPCAQAPRFLRVLAEHPSSRPYRKAAPKTRPTRTANPETHALPLPGKPDARLQRDLGRPAFLTSTTAISLALKARHYVGKAAGFQSLRQSPEGRGWPSGPGKLAWAGSDLFCA